LLLYSELFREIKTQISFISNNINSSVEKERKDSYFNNINDTYDIKEEEENDLDFSLDTGIECCKMIKNEKSKKEYKEKLNGKRLKMIKIENSNSVLRKSVISSKREFSEKSKIEDATYADNVDADNFYDRIDEELETIYVRVKDYKSNFIRDVDLNSNRRSHSLSRNEISPIKVCNGYKTDVSRYVRNFFIISFIEVSLVPSTN
jgi:hypothetical protein